MVLYRIEERLERLVALPQRPDYGIIDKNTPMFYHYS